MEMKTTVEGPVMTVTLSGRVDTVTSPELSAYLKPLFDEGASTIVVDLTDVQYVSSAGLRVILASLKECKQRGIAFIVRHPNEYVMEVFDATGFTDIMTIEQ